MKNKILSLLFLSLLCAVFVYFNLKDKTFHSYKVLKVIEADEFYVDFNNNNKIDFNELVKLKDIIAFSPIKNYRTQKNADFLGLDIEDCLKTGYIARKWAKDNLENNFIQISNPKENNPEIIYKNENLSKFLLMNGLAHLDNNFSDANYLEFQNLKQAKLNSEELSKLDFVILNNKNNIAHKLSCEYAKLISDGTVVLEKDIKNYNKCKICFKQNYDNSVFKIPKNKNIYKKSISKRFGSIELFLINPLQYGHPNEKCVTDVSRAILREINNSKTSIDMALYGIGSQKEFIDALLSAQKRGVKIRCVLDYSKNTDEMYPYNKDFMEKFNTVTDEKNSLMHNKFIIFDNKKVFSGSANISSTDTGGYSANTAVIVDSEEFASMFEKEFEQMFQKKFSKSKEKITNNKIKLENSYITPYFSPKNDIYNNIILPLVKEAREEIFVSIFYLTDMNLINELVLAKNRGVSVLVLIDALGAMNYKDRIKILRDSKIPVIVENWGGKNHEKTIVADEKYLLIGSSNFSKSGFYKNDENSILIENSDIAKLYRDYYLYLFNSIDKKFLYGYPRAEGKESKNSCHDGIDNNFDGKIDSDDDGCK